MNSVPAEKHFIAHVQELMSELAAGHKLDERLRSRAHETLMDGYNRALALEGKRRQLCKRRRELADLPAPTASELREVASLARQEARLIRREDAMRELLEQLRRLAGGEPPRRRITR